MKDAATTPDSTQVPDTPPPRETPRWLGWLGYLGGLILGLVLLVAAWAKAIHPVAFSEQIAREGLDFLLSAPTVAMIALALEVALGAALVLGLRRPWVLWPSGLLVAFFLYLNGRNYWRWTQGLLEDDAECGCFGALVQRTPAEAFWQDLLLLLPPFLLACLAWRWGSQRWQSPRTVAVAVLTVAVLLLAWKAPDLPLDDLATRLKPGVETASICAGSEGEEICFDLVVPELASGRHVVILAELEDPAFEAGVEALNDYALLQEVQDPAPPHPWVVSAATPEQKRTFFWSWGPAFEIREAPSALLTPLYRRLPRSFLVEDGRVVKTWSGLPPLDHLASESGTPVPQG